MAIISLIGNHIKRLKDEKGLSYPFIAKRAGCSCTFAYNICNGKTKFCGISILSKLALSFGYTLEDLLLMPAVPVSNAFGVTKKGI